MREPVELLLGQEWRKRLDPRAGHGAGIGGFKTDSQVGVAALRDGRLASSARSVGGRRPDVANGQLGGNPISGQCIPERHRRTARLSSRLI
jgi:hypothetical protein